MSPPSNKPTTARPKARPAARGWRFGRRLHARLGAERVRVELRTRSGQVEFEQEIEFGNAQAGLGQAAEALGAGLAALRERAGSLRRMRCDIVVADSWMLYDVVRADLRSLSPRAADELIGASLADVAGVQAGELLTRWQAQGSGQCTLACGLPAEVVPAIERALGTHGLRVGSIEGEFVHEYNRHRSKLDAPRAVVALVREAGSQLAIIVDGVLTAMSFELGVRAPEELEVRGRGLLRVAGLGDAEATRFYAMLPKGWLPPAPWVALPQGA
ncbi:MAG TPA: hypothetical protein VF229_03125 [Burkholderiaceae bacterium]